MHELCFKNYFKSLILVLIGVAASSGACFYEIASVELPLPVYILGALTAFLILSSIFYSKANIGQTLQLAILGILINAVNFIGVYYANQYFKLPEIALKPDFILYLNPLIVGVTFIFSILTLCVFVKIKEIKTNSSEEHGINEEIEDDAEISENIAVAEEKSFEDTHIDKNNSSENGFEDAQEEKNPCAYAELYSKKTEKEEFLECDLAENEFEEREIRNDDDEDVLLKEEDISSKKAGTSGNIEFIPTNIRLSDTQTFRETKSKGQVASIGKLLVNDKKIENVIEANETLTEDDLNSRTNIITTISGEKIYEKFSEMKAEFPCIKEIALINKGGFIIANDFEDKQRAQIAGALIAGVYHTLQNYITQLSLDFPVRIFFETAESNSFMLKTADEILFSSWDKEFKHIEYDSLEEIFAIEDFSEADMTPYTDLMEIENMTVADIEGNLVNSLDTENSEQFAAVSSAIFENLKVFLMNIQLIKLSKITIFTPKKVMTIIKTQDKIISLLTDSEEYPKITEELLKMEEI